MSTYLNKDQCCTHREDDCTRPAWKDGLCSGHWRLWKAIGGPYPGIRRYTDITLNGDNYQVLDRHTGQIVISEPFHDWAYDKLVVLRLDEQLDEAA